MRLDVVGWIESTCSVPSITLQFLSTVFEETMEQMVHDQPLRWTSALDLRLSSATEEGNLVIEAFKYGNNTFLILYRLNQISHAILVLTVGTN